MKRVALLDIVTHRAWLFLSAIVGIAIVATFGWVMLSSHQPEAPAASSASESLEPLLDASTPSVSFSAPANPTEPETIPLDSFQAATTAVPFALAGFEYNQEYHRFSTLERWKYQSDLACAEYARALLGSLRSQGLELVEAGYMDLSGECWSCILTDANNAVITVTLIPERPFSPRSSTNCLVVTVLRYLQPQGLDLPAEDVL